MSAPSPRARLALWALLVPLTYAPLYLIGSRPGPPGWLVLGAATAIAGLMPVLLGRTTALDRAAAALEARAGKVLAMVVAAYVVLSVIVARHQLAAFVTFDQAALFAQSYWTLLHGHPFANTQETVDGSLGSHFGIHFSPTLLVLLPLYALFPRPLVLLAAQALALALTVVPLYHLLKREAGPAPALVLALAVLAMPSFAWAGMRDFHDASFLPVLLLTAFWALERRRRGPFLLAAFGALGVREEMGLTLVMLGAYALLRGHGARLGLGIAALGALWMATVIRLVMPRFGSPGLWIDPQRFFVDVLGQWGETPLAAALAMLTHPAALLRALVNGDTARYAYALLSPMLLVPPLLDPVILIGLPGLAVNLLSRLDWMRTSVLYYSLVPATFLALATTRAALRLCRTVPVPRRAGFGLALGIVVTAGALPALPLTHRLVEIPIPPAAPARAVARLIPPEAAAYVPVSFNAALCNREDLGCWESVKQLGRAPEFRARYAFIVLWPASDPASEPHDRPLADSLIADPRFEAIAGYEPFLVFRRRAP